MRRVRTETVLAGLPAAARPLVDALLVEARRRDVALHLVGGPVRDFLLGVPLRDVDLAVEPREGAVRAESFARKALPRGTRLVSHRRFGTVRIEAGKAVVDLATVRRERYAHPGALPRVERGTLEEDLARRDFTVNGLAIPLSARARQGRPAVVDVGGGLSDLEAGILRVFHPESFHDDPTRSLRAARLVPRLGFRLAPATAVALRDALRAGAFARVSGERYRREVEKVFEDTGLGLDPAKALTRLDAWHVLSALEPGLSLPRAAVTPLRRLGRTLVGSGWPSDSLRPWVPGLALWLAPLDRPLRIRTLARLGVRGAVASWIVDFRRSREGLQRSLRRARGRGAADACLGALDDEALHALAASVEPGMRRRILRYVREDRARATPIDGSDLVKLGLRGPAVGVGLARIRSEWLDGAFRTRAQALARARKLAPTL